ncbi:MAG TPA: CYTH domain-containing protein [Planctomycetota bacterium]
MLRLLLLPAAAAAALSLPAAAQQDPTGEFTAHGDNIVRIEDEVKLRVPQDQVEAVWQWLVQRYGDCAWLARDGHTFQATFGDERFVDTYYDDPSLSLLQRNSGVRHRQRDVLAGSAAAKDGRALLQIKLSRDDPSGLARTEIKFKVDPPAELRTAEDQHPMLGLVSRKDRAAVKSRLLEIGLDPIAMRPLVTVEQVRRRVYVADGEGALATVTLDQCNCSDYGTDLHWTEIELELNEIRFTQSKPEQRTWMKGVQTAIQQDLQAKFPAIVQDQTPKYTKSFLAIEQATWMPLRTMVRWRVTPGGLFAIGAGVAIAILAAVLFLVRRLRRRRQAVRA